MNVNAANEDMLSESELKNFQQEERKEEKDGGRWTEREDVCAKTHSHKNCVLTGSCGIFLMIGNILRKLGFKSDF